MDYSVGHGPTALNPYAWIESLNSTAEFSEQALVVFLHRMVANVAAVFGGFLCFFMVYLIMFESKGPLRNYRGMMMMCAVADIEFWAANLVGQEMIVVKNGMSVTTLDGPGKMFSYHTQILVMTAVVSTLTHVVTILPVQFYFSLVPPSTRQTIGLFILSILPITILDSMVYRALRIGGKNHPKQNFAELWYDEYPLHSLLVLDFTHSFVQCYFVVLTIVYSGSYLLTLLFFRLTAKKMSVEKASLRKETIKLQRQLSIYMAIQAGIPTVITVGPMLVVCVGLFLNIDMTTLLLSLSMLVATVPIINPLQTIGVISPFRRRVKALVGIRSVSKYTNSTVQDGRSNMVKEDRTDNSATAR